MVKRKKLDIWLEQFQAGYDLVEANPIFAPLLRHVYVNTQDAAVRETQNFAYCHSGSMMYVNRSKRLASEEWAMLYGTSRATGRTPSSGTWPVTCMLPASSKT